MVLNSKQRAYLRGLINKENAIIQIGKTGITDNLIAQVSEALEARELVKITVLETTPDDIREISNELANSVNAEIVQVIGRKLTLYRAAKKPVIILP